MTPPEIDSAIVIVCPHCETPVLIQKLNCCIFRHGVYAHNMQQIHPHMPENECKQLIQEQKILGCGMPFRVVFQNNSYSAEACDFC